MIVWPAKDPAEELDFTWTVPVDGADTVASFTAAAASGTVVKDSQSSTTTQVILWLSGGTDGETATFTLTATTVGGRTFREVAVLPVFDRASEKLAMFRLRYPAFAAVDDGTVGYWLADAVANVGEKWGADMEAARLALAAHGLAGAGVAGGATSIKSGTFSATLTDVAANRTGFASTSYGREYLDLMRRNFAGPISAWVPPAVIDV